MIIEHKAVSALLLASALIVTSARADSGTASYYGHELAGRRTASGERFNPDGLTAAHRSLAMGTRLLVTNISNGRSVIVRINDRGPFVRSRVLDVSLGAARVLGFTAGGTTRIRFVAVTGSAAPAAEKQAPDIRRPASPRENPRSGPAEVLKQPPA